MFSNRPAQLLVPAAVAGMLVLAACSSSGGGGTPSSAAAGGASARSAAASSAAAGGSAAGTQPVVRVHRTSDGKVLTDARGRTLYVSDQESGKVLCAHSDCTAVWVPLTVTGTRAPAAPAGVQLGTIARPDGSRQVTFGGRPLYTFAFDQSAGATTGDGKHDSFDGTAFAWHAATTGTPAPKPSLPATSAASGYGY
jgi:predicted lipoprotein with Yx(FWY)xxD motif